MELIKGIPATPEDTAEARIEMVRFALSATLRELREKELWRKEDAADWTGRSARSISRMESPYSTHSIDDLIRYVAVAFEGEVLLAIKVGDSLYQVSDEAVATLKAEPGHKMPWEEKNE